MKNDDRRKRWLALRGESSDTVCFGRHGRHPGQRPGTRFGPRDNRPLAALGRFRAGLRHAAQGPDHAGMQEGVGLQPQGRDRQRQRPAVAHHLGDPVRRRSRHHHGVRQLAAALRPEPGRRQRPGRGARQGRGRLLRRLAPDRHDRRQVDRRAVHDWRRVDRLSQVVARGSRVQYLPRNLGRSSARPARSSRPRGGRSGRPRATPSATRRAGGIPSCGRLAARKSRPTARPSC